MRHARRVGLDEGKGWLASCKLHEAPLSCGKALEDMAHFAPVGVTNNFFFLFRVPYTGDLLQ